MTKINKYNPKSTFTRNPFSTTEVQLAKLAHKVPEGEDWLYELKYDGYRILAYIEGNGVRLITRNGNDYTQRFQDVAASLIDWAKARAMVLDGEMVIADPSGKSDFQALQNYLKRSQGKNLTYIVFDLLALDGVDLRGHPLHERKEALAALLEGAPPYLHYSRHVQGNGRGSFRVACEAGMEGIMAKKADSLYSGGRNNDWLKLKCDKRQEFVIGGYTRSAKRWSGVSSLLLGVYEGRDLVYAGRAGTGLKEAHMKELEGKFTGITRTDSPFKMAPNPRTNETITWLEPELVAVIRFAEWTEDQRLRQASFKGLRTDKNPRDITRERAENEVDNKGDEETQLQPSAPEGSRPMKANTNGLLIEGIKISNPDKVIFADLEISKGDVVRYYAKVAERMLPYVSHRVLSIVRCPKGVAQTCFYKKHPGPGSQGIVTIPIITGDGEREEYFYIENPTGLIAEAQMGTLEFHIWGSRVEELEKPDLMVFDLDPDEGMEISRVRQGVRDLRSILAELSLNAYLKTSGGKGYHVVVPLKPAVPWEVFHDFARRVVQVMEQKWPDRYTSNVRKDKRTNKIFIDWIRNGRGATSIAPYSLRARKGACVSMPIHWDELDTVAPDGVHMVEALKRIGGADPWQEFFRNNQRLQ